MSPPQDKQQDNPQSSSQDDLQSISEGKPQNGSQNNSKLSQKELDDFEALLDYLKRSRGSDFTGYKRQSLVRRVLRRMQVVGISGFAEYQDYLEVHPEEFAELFNTILINVTSFFRDREAWDFLASEVIPKIMESKKGSEIIRIWSAGCASGEESFTIAMLMIEALGEEGFKNRVKIFATDIDEVALTQARMATYTPKDLEPVPKEFREKYFQVSGGAYAFRPDLRRSIIFGRHDLVQDAPISHLDLLVCRNTLMYFNAETQTKVLARFHFALKDTGYLFLGRAELLLTHASLFTPVNLKYRMFKKLPKVNMRDKLLVLAQAGDYDAANQLTRQVRLRELSFDGLRTAQIVIDINGNLVLANERARTLLGLGSAAIGKPFQDLEVSYRPVELRSLVEKAYAEHRVIEVKKVERHLPDGSVQYLDAQVSPIFDNGGGPLGVSITFTDVSEYYRLQEELERSKHDLETAYEELQSTNEELETTNEELQSTVEELETTNEELQSTNEELETMNEELQSTNEELQTTNEELRQNTDELNSVNSFLESVFKSLRKGVVVIDNSGKILIWNSEAEDMWGLRSDEVLGKVFLELDIGLSVGQLKEPIDETLKNGKMSEHVLEAINRRGKSLKVRVTLTPLVTQRKENNGAIIMMEEWIPCEVA